jgi:hypothetical protein
MAAPRTVTTFQKNIAPGVSVCIDGVPASVHGPDKIYAFDFATAGRLEKLLALARVRMAGGETEIRFHFADEI